MLLFRAWSTLASRVQHERGRALGIRRRKQRAHLSAVARAEKHCLLRADGIEHNADVFHVRLKRRARSWPVGCPDAPPVEENHARKRGQPGTEVTEQRQ